MAQQSLKEELRSASLKNGEQCVMISGDKMKHWLYAGNWDLLQVVSNLTVSDWTHLRFLSGTEQFIDLRGTGGPDVGIDNSNCTGMEERLVDCNFSREVSDCNSNTHKVGVRCHEESKSLIVAVSSTQACYVYKLMNPLAVLGVV